MRSSVSIVCSLVCLFCSVVVDAGKDDDAKEAANSHNNFAETFASVCAVINSKISTKANVTLLNPLDAGFKPVDQVYFSSSSSDDDPWPFPDVFPLRVKAQGRRSNKIKVTFDLYHVSAAFVASVGSIDYQEKRVNETKGPPRRSTSTVEFTEDASMCKLGPAYYRNAEYLFSLASDDHYVVRATVDLCRFSWQFSANQRYLTYSAKNENKWTQTYIGSFSMTDLPTPRFRLLSDPGDKIYIFKGVNPSVEVEVDFLQAFEFTVHATFWDWDKRKYVTDDVTLDGKKSTPDWFADWNRGRSEMTGEGGESILYLELTGMTFNTTGVRDDYGEEKDHHDVRARIRITVNMGPRNMSGKLTLGYHWKEVRWSVRPVVRSISTERTIAMKLPYKLTIFPTNTIDVRGGEFDCDERGNRGRPRHGKNCTIECHAYGAEIKSVLIIKTKPYRMPVESTSFSTRDAAHTIHDVGPASEDVAGLYRCMAISNNRMVETANVSLHTSGFTKITNLTADDLGNSTSRIVCTAEGDSPLNMSITLSSGNGNFQERLDTKIGNLPYYELLDDNQTTRFILFVCSDQLQVQALDLITCQANGARGEDRKGLYLPRNQTGNCNSPLPKMKVEKSKIKYQKKRNKLKVVCSAIGNKDTDMMLSYGHRGERYRIDKDINVHFRMVRDTEDGMTLSLYIPLEDMNIKEPWSTLHCGAKNKYGSDWVDFNLEDYGL